MPRLPFSGLRSRIDEANRPEPSARRTPPPVRTPADADAAIPYGLRVAAGVSWRAIAVGIALWGLFQVLAATSTVVIPVAVAILLTALCMPLAVFLGRHLHFGRHLAAAVTVIFGILLVSGALTLAGNQLVVGIAGLSQQFSQGVQQIQQWLASGPLQVGNEQIAQAISQGEQWLKTNSGTLTSGAMSVGAGAGNFVAGTLIALIATFFFLAEGDTIWAWFVRLLPQHVQTPVHEAFRRGWVSLSAYVKTQVLVAFIDAVFISLGALLLGLPLIVPMALVIFFASAVPIVGAVVSGALVVVVALVVKGFTAAVIMLVVVLAVQQLESHVLQPILMGRAVSIHPLAVLLGVAGFSFLFGIIGALFAVPFLAVTNSVVMYLKGHDMFPKLADGYSAAATSGRKLTGAGKDAPAQGQAAVRGERPHIGEAGPAELEAQSRLDDARRDESADRDENAEPGPTEQGGR